MTKIIAINAGSSSFKFELFKMPEETEIARGLVERIGLGGGKFTLAYKGGRETFERNFKDHKEAVNVMLEALIKKNIINLWMRLKAPGTVSCTAGKHLPKL